MKLLITLCFVVITVRNVESHGRLLEPPSRSSMFRFAYSDPMLIPHRDLIQPNYLDNQLNCGGRGTQTSNNGKCGVCGDSYTAPIKENEAGGKYALGIITRNYQQGSIIDVTAEITAEHKGYFEFRLCPWNNVHVPITQECLTQNLLTYENGETTWYLPSDPSAAVGMHHLKVKLPDHITCSQCVLQWRYRTGNSWGSENGQEGLGLGQQEEFYGCSDVAIQSSDIIPTSSISSSTSSSVSSTTSPVTSLQSSTVNSQSTTGEEVVTETNPTTTTTTITTTTEVQLYPDVDCNNEELGQPIFRDCHSFYICAFPQHDPYVFACPDGTVCDPKTKQCTESEDVAYCNP